MAYIALQNFKAGLDKRRSQLSAVLGSLIKAENGHINEGGAFEKRQALVSLGKISSGVGYTFGCETTLSGVIVFGSASSGTVGTLPTNVFYQQCIHPAVTLGVAYNAGSHAMTAVRCSCFFEGAVWVAATFADGNTFVYYDGQYVPAFVNGRVLAGYTTNQDIATQLANAITAAGLEGFTVTAPIISGGGYAFQIYCDPSQTFTLVTDETSAGGTLAASLISNSITPIPAIPASASFVLTGGNLGHAAAMTAIYAGAGSPPGGTNLLSSTVLYTTSLGQLAEDIAFNVNTNPALLGAWSAVATGTQVNVSDNSERGTAVNGFHIKTVASGNLCVDNISFRLKDGGGHWAAGDTVTSVQLNTSGATLVEILGTTITFGASDTLTDFVQNIVSAIVANNYGATTLTASTNDVTLLISRLTAASSDALGTVGSQITYTSANGIVDYGAGAAVPAPINVAISPSRTQFPPTGGGSGSAPFGEYTVTYTVVASGGIATLAYAWSVPVVNHARVFVTSSTVGTTFTILIRPSDIFSDATVIVQCRVNDAFGNSTTARNA